MKHNHKDPHVEEEWEEAEWMSMEDLELDLSEEGELNHPKTTKKGTHRNARKAVEDYLEKKRNMELYGDPFEDHK